MATSDRKENSPGFLKKNWLLVVAFLYLFLPIDLIPDAIPVIGTLDDTTLLLIELLRQYSSYRKGDESEE